MHLPHHLSSLDEWQECPFAEDEGLRLQQMDIPAIHLVKTDDVEDASPLMMDAVEMYLSIKGKDDRTFMRTARRNGEYVAKVLGNRPITSY